MEAFTRKRVSPCSGLPTLIQFPIIIGLYQSIIKAMAATPLEILRLNAWFILTHQDSPDPEPFPLMDLGQPERLPILGIQIPILQLLL